MLKKFFIPVILYSIFLSPCLNSSKTFIIPDSAVVAKLQLPEQINFDGELYTKKFVNNNSVEYYLDGEKDYDWTKLITIFWSQERDLDAILQALAKTHQTANAANKSEYEINKLDTQKAIVKELYYPNPNNKKFDKFEANIKLEEIKQCGFISIHYAKNYNKNTNLHFIRKEMFDDKLKMFLTNYPKIECKK